MKFHYYPETDSLYIELAEKPSVDSNEVSPGIVLDFDTEGHLVGIDIDRASQAVDLSRLEAEALPVTKLSLVQPRSAVGKCGRTNLSKRNGYKHTKNSD